MEKIVLCLKHDREYIKSLQEILKEKLQIEVWCIEELSGLLEKALVLTDDGEIAKQCVAHELACAAVLHEQNKGEQFPSGMYCLEKIEEIEADYLYKVYERAKGIPWTILETKRLLLREITVADVPRLYELYQSPEITQYMENLFTDPQEEIEYTRAYIKNVYEFWGYGIWLVIKKSTGEIIGRAGVESKEGEEGLELGFMLGKDYQHQGYACEICQAILQYAKEELSEDNIRAWVHKDNKASINLCEKLGMTKSDETQEADKDGYVRYYLKRPFECMQMQ